MSVVADFPIEALSDQVILVRLKWSAVNLPAGARRRATVVLTGANFYEQPDKPVNLSLILRAFFEPVAGLEVIELPDRVNDGTDARKSRQQRFAFEVANTTSEAISFDDKFITLWCFARAPLESDETDVAQPALVAQPMEFEVTTEANVPLVARFEALDATVHVDASAILDRAIVAHGSVVTARGAIVSV